MPGSQSYWLLWETFDLIGCTIIFAVFYGIVFTLYCLCAQPLYLQLRKPDQRRQTRFTLGYIFLLLFFATGLLALNTRMVQLAYINHADLPGGPLAFENERNSSTLSLSLTGNILEFVIEVSMMAVQVRQ